MLAAVRAGPLPLPHHRPTMPNIHTPERLEGESREAYALRRRDSRAALRTMTLAGIGRQRKEPSSREQLRDSQRRSGHGPKGTYGRGLLEPGRRARAQALQQRAGER